MGSVLPARRFYAHRGFDARAVPSAEADGRPSLDFRSPLGIGHRDPAPSRPPEGGSSDDACSPGLSWPYDTLSGRRTRLRRRFHPPPVSRPGFGYPPRDLHRRPYRHGSCRSVPGLHPSRHSPRPRWVPLSEPLPSWRCRRLPTHALPGERATGDPAVFRASFPRRVRAAAGARKGPGRRCLLGVHPSRASARPTRRTH